MSKLIGKFATAARSAGHRLRNVYAKPTNQDVLVKSSTEVTGSGLKVVLEGGTKRPPQSQPLPRSYLVNTGAEVKHPHPPPRSFPCFMPVASPTRSLPTPTYPDLEPKFPEKKFGGEGGIYMSWKMAVSEVGATKIELLKNGFAPPVFSNGSKVAFVLHGFGRAGLVMEKNGVMEESVLPVLEGDVIAIPEGMVSWWFNPGPSNLVILFIQHSDKEGQCFNDFRLAGDRGIFGGFCGGDLLSRALDLDEGHVTTFVRSQTTKGFILKLADDLNVPVFDVTKRDNVATRLDSLVPSLENAGGKICVLNSTDLPLLEEVGCGVSVVSLKKKATYSPTYSRGSTFQIIYILSGAGKFQVVGASGEKLIDTTVEDQQLFLVPGSSVISASAGSLGLTWISVVDTLSPRFITLAGKGSLLKALSPEVVQATFAVTPELETLVRSKRSEDAFCFPHTPPEEIAEEE